MLLKSHMRRQKDDNQLECILLNGMAKLADRFLLSYNIFARSTMSLFMFLFKQIKIYTTLKLYFAWPLYPTFGFFKVLKLPVQNRL